MTNIMQHTCLSESLNLAGPPATPGLPAPHRSSAWDLLPQAARLHHAGHVARGALRGGRRAVGHVAALVRVAPVDGRRQRGRVGGPAGRAGARRRGRRGACRGRRSGRRRRGRRRRGGAGGARRGRARRGGAPGRCAARATARGAAGLAGLGRRVRPGVAPGVGKHVSSGCPCWQAACRCASTCYACRLRTGRMLKGECVVCLYSRVAGQRWLGCSFPAT